MQEEILDDVLGVFFVARFATRDREEGGAERDGDGADGAAVSSRGLRDELVELLRRVVGGTRDGPRPWPSTRVGPEGRGACQGVSSTPVDASDPPSIRSASLRRSWTSVVLSPSGSILFAWSRSSRQRAHCPRTAALAAP
jgi:hypothetical protein